MYELVKLTDKAYYIESPAKVGVILHSENKASIIDSGNDKDAGKKIKKILDANGWALTSILNTHSHADHIGGNKYLKEQTGCSVYAAGIERDFTVHPILEPTALYGGNPPSELRHKFLMAQPSDALPLTNDILPEGAQAVPLAGHSFDMVGFKTDDGVLFLADCLSSAETLDKYRIGYLSDVGAYLQTLEKVMTMEAKYFVPSHAAVTDDIVPLARLNIEKVNEVGDLICEICRAPIIFEDILAKIFDTYELKMTFEQYALIGSTLRSYLTWLKNTERVTAEINGSRMVWRSI